MRTLLRPLLATLLVVAALLSGTVGGTAAPAVADPTPSAPTDGATDGATDAPVDPVDRSDNITFGIGPAHAVPEDQVVDGRPYLQYLSGPGGAVRDTVALINYGTEPIALNVYVTDAVQGTDGAFGLKAGDATPSDAGSWFRLRAPGSRKLVARARITVPGRKGGDYGRVDVPLEARIPLDATPGDHVGGVIASLVSTGKDADGARIKFDQRIGLRTYFRLSGDLEPQLAVENLHASYDWSPEAHGRDSVTVTYDVRNTGNVRMNAAQLVNLQRPFRDDIIVRPAPVADLLPGATLSVSQTVEGNFSAGPLTPLVSLIPVPVDDTVPADRTPVQGSVEVWAWQWIVAAVVVVLLLLLLLALGLRRWRGARVKVHGGRRRRTGKPAPEPQPVARVAVIGLATFLVAAVAAFVPAAHADVSKPGGGKIFLEAGKLTGEPERAITDGVWGHEGKDGKLGTFVVADLTDSSGRITDASQAFWMKRFGITDFNNIGIAFVRASADGTTERPKVTKGQTAADVFEWFTDFSLGVGWAGTGEPYTDQVAVVHTKAEFADWIKFGSPAQVYDDKLVAHDALVDGEPVSAHPSGRSIQNRWPAGEKLSLVMFQYDGFDENDVPIVAVADDGRARSAWLTFRTVAGKDDPSVRTSAGYHVLGASVLPKKPSEVSKDPSAEVNGKKGATSPDAGDAATGTPDGTPAASATGSSSVIDEPASFGTLWTGSGWAWPIVGLLIAVGVFLAATSLLRGRVDRP